MDGHESSPPAATRIPHRRTGILPGGGTQISGFTPFPAVASARRSEPPSVRTRWA